MNDPVLRESNKVSEGRQLHGFDAVPSLDRFTDA